MERVTDFFQKKIGTSVTRSDDVVEARGVEPLSEDLRDKLSTGLAVDLSFPCGDPQLLDAVW